MMKKITILLFIIFTGILNAQHYDFATKIDGEKRLIKIFPASLKAFEAYRYHGVDVEIYNEKNELLFDGKLQAAGQNEWPSAEENAEAQSLYRLLYEARSDGQINNMDDIVRQNKELNISHAFFTIVSCMDGEASRLSGLEIELEKDLTNAKIVVNPDSKMETTLQLAPKAIFQFSSGPQITAYELESAVQINWSHEMHFSQVMGYRVQRKKGNGNFENLGNANIAYTTTGQERPQDKYLMNYTDSVTNYIDYEYRLIAFDAFGDKLEAANVVEAHGVDLTPPDPPVVKQLVYENGNANITWEYPDNSVTQVMIMRSNNGVNGPFELRNKKKLNGKTTSFSDPIENPEEHYYYIVAVADSADNMAQTLPQFLHKPDDSPPTPPTDLQAHVDSTGLVTLMWHHSDAKDLQGYRVFRSNYKKHEFLQVSEGAVGQNIFYDQLSLQSNDAHAFYFLRAMDKSNNHSVNSDTVMVIRPDTICPSNAILRRATLVENKINLAWIPSSSDDVVAYIIEADTGNGWWQHSQVEANTTETTISSFSQYKTVLRITARDEVGNTGKNAPAKAVFLNQPTEALDFNLQLSDNKININWASVPDGKAVLIYRSTDDDQYSLIHQVRQPANSYSEKPSNESKKYYYKLALMDNSGAKTRFTTSKSITVQ